MKHNQLITRKPRVASSGLETKIDFVVSLSESIVQISGSLIGAISLGTCIFITKGVGGNPETCDDIGGS